MASYHRLAYCQGNCNRSHQAARGLPTLGAPRAIRRPMRLRVRACSKPLTSCGKNGRGCGRPGAADLSPPRISGNQGDCHCRLILPTDPMQSNARCSSCSCNGYFTELLPLSRRQLRHRLPPPEQQRQERRPNPAWESSRHFRPVLVRRKRLMTSPRHAQHLGPTLPR